MSQTNYDRTQEPTLENSWIGVDFDRTLAQGVTFGPPVEAMKKRVTRWVTEGRNVRILTARACRDIQSAEERAFQIARIESWCEEYLGFILPVTAEKDYNMIELWDDRAVGVIPDTGKQVRDEEYQAGYIAGVAVKVTRR